VLGRSGPRSWLVDIPGFNVHEGPGRARNLLLANDTDVLLAGHGCQGFDEGNVGALLHVLVDLLLGVHEEGLKGSCEVVFHGLVVPQLRLDSKKNRQLSSVVSSFF
jgi:hypothetical protein